MAEKTKLNDQNSDQAMKEHERQSFQKDVQEGRQKPTPPPDAPEKDKSYYVEDTREDSPNEDTGL